MDEGLNRSLKKLKAPSTAISDRVLKIFDPNTDEEIKAIKKELKEIKKKTREFIFMDSVPLRYKNVNFQGDQRLIESPRIVIYGGYGCGKTYLGHAIIKELYVNDIIDSYLMETERDIYNFILAHQKNPEYINELYKHVDLLVIDELGKNSGTDASTSQIFNIINDRYSRQLRTILICNASNPEDLGKIVPKAIQDRFKGSTFFLGNQSRREPE